MKKSKIRNILKTQLLFSGFTEFDNTKYWYEVKKYIHDIEFTITIHQYKSIYASIRVYSQNKNPIDFKQYDLALNTSTFENIINYIQKYAENNNCED